MGVERNKSVSKFCLEATSRQRGKSSTKGDVILDQSFEIKAKGRGTYETPLFEYTKKVG